MIEYAMLHDITRLVFVTHGSFVPRILSVGWDVELLGLPYHDAQCGSIVAMVLRITPATLQLVRARWGLTEAMLVLAPQMAEAA